MSPIWTPPSEFEEYRLLRRLGQGSMGQVWLAHDLLLDRRVAIKFIGTQSDDLGLKERFLNEARAIAKLSHPNVVTVFRIGTIDRQPYMVSELVEGTSLDQLPKPVSSPIALKIGIDLARGLAAAHRAGILHRDIKPANAIFTSDETAKLLDFGLAKFAGPLGGNPNVGENSLSREVTTRIEAKATPVPNDGIEITQASPIQSPGQPALFEHASPILTQQGAIIGTPLYLAPECWRGEAATRRSDVYSLGALLYELCVGQAPSRFLSQGPLIDVVQNEDAKALSSLAPAIDRRLTEIVDRALSRDPAQRFSSGDDFREALEQLTAERSTRIPEGNPYRGLAAFEADHQALFFGRAREVRSVCDRLRSGNFVVVAGESGVGKSSLCRAGVLPSIVNGNLGDGRAWRSASLLPGRHPLRSLASALAPSLEASSDAIEAELQSAPQDVARRLAQRLGDTQGIVLFVDQLEEWCTFADNAEARAASRALAAFVDAISALRVVATVRVDLLSRLSMLPGLGSAVAPALFLLGPVEPEHLRQVVVGPALAFGVTFESEAMVDDLVAFAAQGGSLPLLQFALAKLWEHRGDGKILKEATLLEMGGAAGALAAHADNVVAKMPADHREAAQQILVALVSSDDHRRRRPESELVFDTAVRKQALHMLAIDRLVVPRDSEDGTVWEIAHEALLRAWPTLKQWLSADVELREVLERLSRSTREWVRLDRSPEALWGERQMIDFDRLFAGEAPKRNRAAIELGSSEQAFVDRSRRRIRQRKLRVPLTITGIVLSIAGTGFAIDAYQQRDLSNQATKHLAQAAEEHRLARVELSEWEHDRSLAFKAFDEGDWLRGEALWSSARKALARWTQHVGLADAEIENAQRVSPTHDKLQPALVRAAELRIALDEATGRSPEIDAEMKRLESLGVAATEIARFRAKAKITLQIEPQATDIEIARFENVETRARLGAFVRTTDQFNVDEGSYVLRLSHPEYAEIRLPFVARRGEQLQLRVQLLPRNRLPSGFVHIPAGLTFVGSAGDESVRREFYEAAPLHQTHVDDFLIARHEVTFADWIVYLQHLSLQEQAARLPKIVSNLGTADTANLQLERRGGRWHLAMAPIARRYSAWEGDFIHYDDRSMNEKQDWLQMPVVGISPIDVEAYAAWLAQTGRVPGARICQEYEWERAARGADGRTLPHGEMVIPSDANIDETYGRKDAAFGPDEVGIHPNSRSPFDIDDMLGNVWEIVRPTSRAKTWVNKGGSWQVNTLSARIPNHWVINPGYRQIETGARICASIAAP